MRAERNIKICVIPFEHLHSVAHDFGVKINTDFMIWLRFIRIQLNIHICHSFDLLGIVKTGNYGLTELLTKSATKYAHY